jgi:hypothetical protein
MGIKYQLQKPLYADHTADAAQTPFRAKRHAAAHGAGPATRPAPPGTGT